MGEYGSAYRRAVIVLAALGCLLGLSPAAGASTLLYHGDNVAVRAAGAAAAAVNQCLVDVQDGVTVIDGPCDHIATSAGGIHLDAVSVWVFPPCGCDRPLFSRTGAAVDLSGGAAAAIGRCIEWLHTPHLDELPEDCRLYHPSGNILSLSHISVSVYG
jgi:hypothetical protein